MLTALEPMSAPELLADNIASFERRLVAKQPISLDEVRELERKTEPLREGPHYQLAQRVRKLALRLGHVAVTQWEDGLSRRPCPSSTWPNGATSAG